MKRQVLKSVVCDYLDKYLEHLKYCVEFFLVSKIGQRRQLTFWIPFKCNRLWDHVKPGPSEAKVAVNITAQCMSSVPGHRGYRVQVLYLMAR